MEWVYVKVNDITIRINKNNSRDIYSFRENKKTPSYWLKRKLIMTGNYYQISIRGEDYYVHRLVYKAYNPNWDMDNKNSVIKHVSCKTLDNQIENLYI